MTVQPTRNPDDASALLATILDDTREDAEHEELAMKRALSLQREADEERVRVEEARKRADAERRLREEAERQRHARSTRLSMVRAIEGPSEEEVAAQRRAEEEARRAAEFQRRLDEAEVARHQAEERAAEAARVARAREEQRLRAVSELTPQQAPKRSAAAVRMFAAAGAFALLLVAGIGGVLAASAADSQVPQRVYTKASWAASPVESPSTLVGFVPEPKAEPEPVSEADDAPAARKPGRWRQRNNGQAGKGSNPFGDLNVGSNVFGSGKE